MMWIEVNAISYLQLYFVSGNIELFHKHTDLFVRWFAYSVRAKSRCSDVFTQSRKAEAKTENVYRSGTEGFSCSGWDSVDKAIVLTSAHLQSLSDHFDTTVRTRVHSCGLVDREVAFRSMYVRGVTSDTAGTTVALKITA